MIAPACGWYDPIQIQCFAFPCATNSSNPCIACRNKQVKYVSCGVCPATSYLDPLIKYVYSLSTTLPKCY